MDARIYEDNFPDGDQSNGLPHSLNGVDHIEVLKGPGSALFGTSTPGGTVNIVHFLPSSVPGYGLSTQLDSYGGWYNSIYATGPTGVPGLNYRVDGLLQYSDGFRGLKNNNYELRPEWSWTNDNHFTVFALDFRHIERTPDGYGIVYVNGRRSAACRATPNIRRRSVTATRTSRAARSPTRGGSAISSPSTTASLTPIATSRSCAIPAARWSCRC